MGNEEHTPSIASKLRRGKLVSLVKYRKIQFSCLFQLGYCTYVRIAYNRIIEKEKRQAAQLKNSQNE